jgi:hypothetical protein
MRLSFVVLLAIAACGGVDVEDPDASSGANGVGGGGGEPGSGGSSDGGSGSGSGGSGGSGGSAVCTAPTEMIELSLLGTECYLVDFGTTVTLDGAIVPLANGFGLAHGAQVLEVTGTEAAIPDGTFVRLTYSCNHPLYGSPGAYLLIENLPELDGDPNPTEDGERLWLFVAAGGGAAVPTGVPFQTDTTAQCKEGTGPVWREPHLVTVSGDGFSATAPPTGAAAFTVPSGPDAGDYQLENVNWSSVANYDIWYEVNYRIARSP